MGSHDVNSKQDLRTIKLTSQRVGSGTERCVLVTVWKVSSLYTYPSYNTNIYMFWLGPFALASIASVATVNSFLKPKWKVIWYISFLTSKLGPSYADCVHFVCFWRREEEWHPHDGDKVLLNRGLTCNSSSFYQLRPDMWPWKRNDNCSNIKDENEDATTSSIIFKARKNSLLW